MLELEKKEGDLVVAVKIELLESKKKYFFFGEDVFITSTMYYPIPPTKYDGALRTDQSLSMKDEVGTLVKLNIVYDNPAKSNKDMSMAE